MVETETYDSFPNSTGSARTRYGYTGREHDPDTSMLPLCVTCEPPRLPGRFRSFLLWGQIIERLRSVGKDVSTSCHLRLVIGKRRNSASATANVWGLYDGQARCRNNEGECSKGNRRTDRPFRSRLGKLLRGGISPNKKRCRFVDRKNSNRVTRCNLRSISGIGSPEIGGFEGATFLFGLPSNEQDRLPVDATVIANQQATC